MKELGLKDLIVSIHPLLSPPATFNRNNSQTPVNEIWGNLSLEVFSAGYGQFNGGYPSALLNRHRFLWIIISDHSLLGKYLPITNPTIRTERLNSEDKQTRKISTRRIRKEYCKQNIFKTKTTLVEKARWFWKGTTGISYKDFLNTFTPKMDALHITTRKIKKMVVANLWKIYVGGQDFSPKAQTF